MADNFVRTPGTGENVAGDEVTDATLGTVKVQYVKLMDGTPDGTTKAAVGANGLAVDVKAMPSTAVTNADITSCKTALEIIDDWDSSDHCNIRHLNATDDTLVLATGANAIGKLAANSGVDIGDVDILSIAAGANTIGNVNNIFSVANCIQWVNYSQDYTTTQTSADLVAASGATKIYVGRITIGTSSTTSGIITIYFGTSDYANGSKLVFRGGMAPTTVSYPGVVIGNGSAPFTISAASAALKITTSAAVNCHVSVDYIQV